MEMIRGHLHILRCVQKAKHPKNNFITWPIVFQLIIDVNNYYKCEIVSTTNRGDIEDE